MCDCSPDSIGLVVDTQYPHRYTGASGRTPSFGIAAQAIDAAIQRDENSIHIHHTDRADISVSYNVPTKRFLIRVLTRLLNGSSDPDMLSVAAVNAQDLDQNTLSRLEIILRIHHPLQ